MSADSPIPSRPDLTRLTPMQANRLVTHFIHRVHPELTPPETRTEESPIRLLGMPAPTFRWAPTQSDLSPDHFISHFARRFEGMGKLKELVEQLTIFAMASVGKIDLDAESIAVFERTMATAWEAIDAAKRDMSTSVNREAVQLERAILEFHQQQPGHRFLPTRAASAVGR